MLMLKRCLTCMIRPYKFHTNNLIPFVIVNPNSINILNNLHINRLKIKGCLANITPTILDLLQIEIPKDISSIALIKNTTKKLSLI